MSIVPYKVTLLWACAADETTTRAASGRGFNFIICSDVNVPLSCKVVASHATSRVHQYGVSFVPITGAIGSVRVNVIRHPAFVLTEQGAFQRSYLLTIAPVQFTRVALSGGTGNDLNAKLGCQFFSVIVLN